MTRSDLVDHVAGAIEIAGVALIAAGLAWGMIRVLRAAADATRFVRLRHDMGCAILLGLEVLVAADIVRTVADTPTPMRVATLAGVVAIRTFLSWSLALELDGRWPWQSGERKPLTDRPTDRSSGVSPCH